MIHYGFCCKITLTINNKKICSFKFYTVFGYSLENTYEEERLERQWKKDRASLFGFSLENRFGKERLERHIK